MLRIKKLLYALEDRIRAIENGVPHFYHKADACEESIEELKDSLYHLGERVADLEAAVSLLQTVDGRELEQGIGNIMNYSGRVKNDG